jgi:tRNA(Ile)-lysidine synthetase-like protein
MSEPDVSRHPLVRGVAQALRRRCRVSAGEAMLVAVSGGADSVALLRALAVLAPRRTWHLRLTVAHVHHHLRPDADADSRFVDQLCQRLDVPFVQRDICPGDAAGNVEAEARTMRYAALGEIAQEQGCGTLATAHHADDQLETLLMRLIRGTSVQGMRGVAWRRRLDAKTTLIRPLLGATHAMAIDLCRTLDQPWREDLTNADLSRTRARLRQEVLPVLRDLRPDAAAKAQSLAEQCQRAARLVSRHTLAWDSAMRPTKNSGFRINREVLRAVDGDVAAQIIHRLLIRSLAAPDAVSATTVEQIARASRDHTGGERYFFVGGIVAGVDRRAVFAGPAVM